MKFSANLRRLLALASFALVTPASLFGAQSTPTPAVTAPAKAGNMPSIGQDYGPNAPTANTPIIKPAFFTLEIRHGSIIENGKEIGPATVGYVLDYVRKKNPDFSVLYPGVADVPVGDLYLHLPDFDFNAICSAIAKSSSDLVFDNENGNGVPSLTLAPSVTQDRDVAVFNLTIYLNPDGKADSKAVHEKYDSVVDVILHTLRDLNPNATGSAAPDFQFHEGANLLVVTGTHQAIDVAGKVVYGLTHLDNQPANASTSSFSSAPVLLNDATDQMLQADKLGAAINDLEKTINVEDSSVKRQAEQQKLLELQTKLEELTKKMQSLPQTMNASAAAGDRVTVVGQVNKAGVIPMPASSHMTVSEAILNAGGFTKWANHQVKLTRQNTLGQTHTYEIDLDAVLTKGEKDKDMELMSGDVIYAEEAFFTQF